MKWIAVAVGVISVLVHFLVLRKEFPVHDADGEGIILISGTSSGIGRAACGWLAERHPRMTLYCGVRREVEGSPFDLPNVKQIILDITNKEHYGVFQEIAQAKKPLIAVVNNAGINDMETFELLGVERLRTVLEVNVIGTYQLTQASLPLIRETKGRVVTVSSVSGLFPGAPLISAYQGSKHCLEAMFDSLRAELTPLDVSVSLINPGFLESSIVTSRKDTTDNTHDDNHQEVVKIYSHVTSESYRSMVDELASATGSMEETCLSIDDAIFSRYPKTRYMTSRLGAIPSWIAGRVFNALPSRLTDILSLRLEPVVYLTRIRALLQQLLGFR
ncbi:Short-chain dehydrogenase/reductase family 9C member 7 [Seminavis robusta]|uniref:Short-chain dehydrogenase/reductase family 9C member 7 n=1 Tax=Seminavis robusta TaxID=568900 RepID=A0A9N8DB45_9STRA|nr:Short-chain dehydrogenase/reductase family 9C member 7 [Seminavis robusta]|eukprot:Sro17_g012060.1 Short-chain dehydrogenase/reductase family 9C member 7 (331) ;mRNA; r:14753-15745